MPSNIQRTGSVLPILGLDSSKPAEYLTEQFSPDNQNMRVIRDQLVKRDGLTQFGDQISGTETYIHAGREFESTGTRYNVRIGQDKIEHYVGGSWSDITGSDLTGGNTNDIDTAIPLLSGSRILAFTNGVDNVRKWIATGNTADLGGSPPTAKYIQEYKTYLVLANITSGTVRPQRVQWSDTDNIEEWTTGNAGSVDLIEDGDDISGLTIYADYLCVHKRNAIYLGDLVSNNQIFNFQRIPTEIGCVSNNTIKNIQTGEQVFLSNAGIAIFNGSNVTLLDDRVNDEIRDTLNPKYITRAWAVTVRERNEVWFGIPTTDFDYPNVIYRFNYIDRTVFKDKYTNITSAWRFTQTSGITWDSAIGTWDEQTRNWNENDLSESFPLISLSDKDGYTYTVDATTANDDGVAVEAYWDSKDFQIDSTGVVTRWQRMELWAKGNTVDVEYSIDEGQTWTSIKTVTLTDTYPTYESPIYLYFDVVSSKIRFRFKNDTVDESFTLKQFAVGYVTRELR